MKPGRVVQFGALNIFRFAAMEETLSAVSELCILLHISKTKYENTNKVKTIKCSSKQLIEQ